MPALALALVSVATLGAMATAGARAHGRPVSGGRTGDQGASNPFALADAVRRLRATMAQDAGDAPNGAGGDGADDMRADAGAADRSTPARAWIADRIAARDRAGRRAAAALAAGHTPWWADTAHWAPGAVFWSERTAPPLVADAGDTLALPIPDLPVTLPEALRARGVHWGSVGPVALLGGGRVLLEGPGAAAVDAVTPVGITHTPITVRPVVRGRAYTLDAGDGGSTADHAAANARVVVRWGATADTTWTDAAGRFRLAVPPDVDDAAEVRVEPSDPAAGAAVLRDVPAARLHALGVVLLPARWTVAAGRYAGTAVPIRPAAARGYWQFAPGGGRGEATRRPVGWRDGAPHTLAFAPGFTAADTAVVWRAAHVLEDAWGRPLFVPARGGPASDGADSADVLVRPAPALSADGLTTLGWDEDGAVGAATVELRVRGPGTLQEPVVVHELMHALGFGHARGWPTALTPAGRVGAGAPTPADVAYAEVRDALVRAARRAAAEYGAAYTNPFAER